MANNVFQVKRTNTAGRTPNTTGSYVTNSQYIAAGEFALNMADGILYTSNGSALIEVGGNNTNQNITGNLFLSVNNKKLSFTPVAGGSNVYFIQQNDDNFVFYNSNTTNGSKPVFNVYSNTNYPDQNSGFRLNVPLDIASVPLYANGTQGTAGQYLTSNGTGTYWSSPGVASVNTAAQYTWTNTHTFNGNVNMAYAVFANTNGQLNATAGDFKSNAYALLGGAGGNYLAIGQQSNFAQWIQSGYSAASPVYYNIVFNPLGGNVGVGNTVPAHKLRVDGDISTNGGIHANGSVGSSGQYLTSNGTVAYWSSPGAVSVNTSAQYTWSNLHTFQANVSFTGNGIGLTTNTGAIYFNQLTDLNWKIGRNTGGTTKFFYTNNSLDIIAANSPLEGIAFGFTGNSYLEMGYAGTFTRNPIYVGNTTQNVATTNTTILIQANTTVNSTITGSLVQVSNSTSIANLSAIDLKIGTTVVNSSAFALGTAFTANSTVVNAVSYYSGSLLVANTTVINATHLGGTAASGYQTTAGLAANVATLAANSASYTTSIVGGLAGSIPYQNAPGVTTFVTIGTNTFIMTSNGSVPQWTNPTSVTVGTANNSSYLGGNLPAYYTNATNITTGTLPYAQIPANIVNTTGSFTLSGNTTLAGTTTTISSNVNITGTFLNVASSFVVNSTGGYHTGTINAASHTVGTSVVANTSGVYVGSVSATTNGSLLTNTVLQVGNTLTYSNVGPGVIFATANITSPLFTGNIIATYVSTTANVTVGSVNATANGALLTNTVLQIGNTSAYSNVGPGFIFATANITSPLFTGNVTGTASNATNLNSQPGSYYTNATNITTGTLPWAQAPSGTVNTSGSFTFSNTQTFSANITTNGLLTQNGISVRVVDYASGTTLTMNCDSTDLANSYNTQAAGTLTINPVTGTARDGQKLMLRLRSSNVQTFAWNTSVSGAFAGSTDLSLPTASSGSSKYDYMGFIYSTATSRWHLLAKNFGF